LGNFGGHRRKIIRYFYQIKVRTQAVETLSRRYPLLGMSLMCSWFGFSRQAWYAAIKQMEKNLFEFDLVTGEIKRIRKRIHRIGSGKLYELIKPFFFFHQLKIGRDKLHQLMKKEGLWVKKKQYKTVTTQSDHSFKK
jgi:hypothetical protein